MRPIRFLQLGSANNTLISNLCVTLSSLGTGITFTFDGDVVGVDGLVRSSDGRYDTKILTDAALDYMAQHRYREYPIAVTDLPLQDDVAASTDSVGSLLSTYDWVKFSAFPVSKGLEYLVAGVLLDMHEVVGVHYDTRGCLNDFCDARKDLDVGIGKAELCPECRRAVMTALEKETMSPQEVTATWRVLDHVAGRTMCLVIMPFRDKFAKPYEAMKKTLVECGFTAVRADEVFETRGIVQIVLEQMGRAELVVADLTDCNPNVFYELGYAHALGKAVILLTQRKEDVPFDLRHRQYVLYSPRRLTDTLTAGLRPYLEAR
jgi:hypothetical protein